MLDTTTQALIAYDSVIFRAQELPTVPPDPSYYVIPDWFYNDYKFFELTQGFEDMDRNPGYNKTSMDTNITGDSGVVPSTEKWHIRGFKMWIETTHRHNIWQHIMLYQMHQTGVMSLKFETTEVLNIPIREIFTAPKTTLTDVSRLSTDTSESWYDLDRPNTRMIEGGISTGFDLGIPFSIPSGINFQVQILHYQKAIDHYKEWLERFYLKHYGGALPLDPMPFYHDEYKVFFCMYGFKEFVNAKVS